MPSTRESAVPLTLDWQRRLQVVVEMIREISLETDPQAMVRSYRRRLQEIRPSNQYLSLSRRDLEFPRYRITRSSRWSQDVNPWKQKERLPLLEGGLLSELIYGSEPRIIDELDVDPDDPAREYLEGQRSLMALPHFEQGVVLNMVVVTHPEPAAFDREEFPEQVLLSNLFGKVTQTLALAEELRSAYAVVDRELKVVADIQRSLLPKKIPALPGFDLAAHYQTSRWAGGDYYDFFPLPDGRLGILIADVSGHGTPAAVMMAITHSIAHLHPEGISDTPDRMLRHLNEQLLSHYTSNGETFVTAFYGVYDPARRALTYASAGHNPPRLKRCEDGSVLSLDGVGALPLGTFPDQDYEEHTSLLRPGDQIIFYTDGITEATDASGEMFGMGRLDEALANCHLTADGLIHAVLDALEQFTGDRPATDDRTMLVAKVS